MTPCLHFLHVEKLQASYQLVMLIWLMFPFSITEQPLNCLRRNYLHGYGLIGCLYPPLIASFDVKGKSHTYRYPCYLGIIALLRPGLISVCLMRAYLVSPQPKP